MRRPVQNGVTLAELLVVLGIIAVLMGLILPVISGVRQSALTAACLSNLRQIGVVAELYAADHSGRYPASRNHGETDPAHSPAWFYRLPAYVERADTRGQYTIFQSPTYHWREPEIFNHASPKSYKMNDYLGRGRRTIFPSYLGVRDAAEIVFFANAVAGETGMGQWGHLFPSGVDWQRHGGRTTVLFFDGHGTSVVEEPEDGDAESVLKFKSRYW